MKKEDKKAYYAVIPADVRYDESLPAGAKLLYGEITALCGKEGFCWASNSYFAELYGKEKGTISRWIAQLIENGYIQAEIDKKEGNKRKLFISTNTHTPIDKNDHTYRQKRLYPIGKNAYTYSQNCQDPISKNAYHNNKDNNTKNNTKNNTNDKKASLLNNLSSNIPNDQHLGFSLLVCRGVDEKTARTIVYNQHTPFSSIEEVVKNGLAKEDHAVKTGGEFRLKPGYIINALKQARSEGKLIKPTKLSKKLSARISNSKRKHTPLDQAEFEKRKRQQLEALIVK